MEIARRDARTSKELNSNFNGVSWLSRPTRLSWSRRIACSVPIKICNNGDRLQYTTLVALGLVSYSYRRGSWTGYVARIESVYDWPLCKPVKRSIWNAWKWLRLSNIVRNSFVLHGTSLELVFLSQIVGGGGISEANTFLETREDKIIQNFRLLFIFTQKNDRILIKCREIFISFAFSLFQYNKCNTSYEQKSFYKYKLWD